MRGIRGAMGTSIVIMFYYSDTDPRFKSLEAASVPAESCQAACARPSSGAAIFLYNAQLDAGTPVWIYYHDGTGIFIESHSLSIATILDIFI